MELYFKDHAGVRFAPSRIDALVLLRRPRIASLDLSEPGGFESFYVIAAHPRRKPVSVGEGEPHHVSDLRQRLGG